MAGRSYGQFCGLGHALDTIGERWALLIVRDLANSPKRFTELRQGLLPIPTNVLSARLKQLEGADVIRRRILPPPSRSIVYELTPYGRELDDVMISLERWGSRTLTSCGPDQTVTADSLLLALRSMFRPEAATGDPVVFELRWDNIRIQARAGEGRLELSTNPDGPADLVIEASFATHDLMTGEITPEQAIAEDRVSLTGDPALLTRFVEVFHL